MALETLVGVKEIGGFAVGVATKEEAPWLAQSESVWLSPFYNAVTFRLQLGPVKVYGVNGCDVNAMIEAAKIMLVGLNSYFHSDHNDQAIASLEDALNSLARRKAERLERGVEGHNLP